MGEVGAKSNWIDASGTEVENEAVLALYKKLKQVIVKNLDRGMYGINTRNDRWSFYRNIYFSKGAFEFQQHGGQLRQRAGGTVIFKCGSAG